MLSHTLALSQLMSVPNRENHQFRKACYLRRRTFTFSMKSMAIRFSPMCDYNLLWTLVLKLMYTHVESVQCVLHLHGIVIQKLHWVEVLGAGQAVIRREAATSLFQLTPCISPVLRCTEVFSVSLQAWNARRRTAIAAHHTNFENICQLLLLV